MLRLGLYLLLLAAGSRARRADYTGHRVLSVRPRTEGQIHLLHRLRADYGVDLWNEPRALDVPVMVQLSPHLADAVERQLAQKGVPFEVAIADLERTIEAERIQNAPSAAPSSFDFSRYNEYEKIVQLLKDLSTEFSDRAKLETIGKSYENRPIYNLKVSSSDSSRKEAIVVECGIHAREWTSVATCAYLVYRLLSSYDSDAAVKRLLDKYELNVVVESNPDGYVYTWQQDRMWRKTRSRSSIDWLGVCRGVDANRNFDIEHCGVGTSRKPCDEIYCGEKPFSESESRALRDLMIALGNRTRAYFSIHAFSQLWMTPYGTTKKLPPTYAELERIGKIGAAALANKYSTQYRVGSIANIIYEATGSSVDYAYAIQKIPITFALELRDTGRHGFFLPQQQILPTCEETFEGLQAAFLAL